MGLQEPCIGPRDLVLQSSMVMVPSLPSTVMSMPFRIKRVPFRIGRDPEMHYTPGGQPVTSFSVASNRRFTTASGEQRDEAEWFNVSAWGRLADLCNKHDFPC